MTWIVNILGLSFLLLCQVNIGLTKTRLKCHDFPPRHVTHGSHPSDLYRILVFLFIWNPWKHNRSISILTTGRVVEKRFLSHFNTMLLMHNTSRLKMVSWTTIVTTWEFSVRGRKGRFFLELLRENLVHYLTKWQQNTT